MGEPAEEHPDRVKQQRAADSLVEHIDRVLRLVDAAGLQAEIKIRRAA